MSFFLHCSLYFNRLRAPSINFYLSHSDVAASCFVALQVQFVESVKLLRENKRARLFVEARKAVHQVQVKFFSTKTTRCTSTVATLKACLIKRDVLYRQLFLTFDLVRKSDLSLLSIKRERRWFNKEIWDELSSTCLSPNMVSNMQF